jgi:SAM-dependent methyltransferase
MSIATENPKTIVKSQWGAAAAGWDHWSEWYARNFQPVIAWCCDAALLKPGCAVLDLACGSGEPALDAARRVQPGWRVTAIDIAPEMLAVAERRAEQAGIRNIEFQGMDAENLRLPDEAFDAVTFAYGLMFCPDAVRAVAEARRVLKPGGRFAFVLWDEPAKSPFLTVAGRSLAQLFPAQPPDPNAPGAFRFSQPGALDAILRAGGFTDFSIESRPMTLECGSIAEYWQLFTDVAAGVKAKVASLAEPDAARLRELVETAAGPYVEGGRVRLEATSLCVSGRR